MTDIKLLDPFDSFRDVLHLSNQDIEGLVLDLYEQQGFKRPAVLFAQSPQKARKYIETLKLPNWTTADMGYTVGAEPSIHLAHNPYTPAHITQYSTLFNALFDTTPTIAEVIQSPIHGRWSRRVIRRSTLYKQLTQSTFAFLMYDQVCIVISSHSRMKRDAEDLLHCEDGVAVEFPDGKGWAFWRGTHIPEAWVRGEPPRASEALAIRNIEQRRCACEIIGWAHIVEQLHGRIINEDPNPMIGTLIVVDLPRVAIGWGEQRWDDGSIRGIDERRPQKFLRVVCGTGRTFALPVPMHLNTAREANAWTYGLDPSEYQPEVRT